MAIKLKNKLFLKKSFLVRKNFDIILNSKYLVILHVDKIYGNLFDNLKSEMSKIGVEVFLLNKDRFIVSSFFSISKGPTLMLYSSTPFYFKLMDLLEQNKNLFQVLLIKNENFVSSHRFNLLTNKYANFSISKVNIFLFFLLNYYKNFLFFLMLFFKFFYAKLIYILKQKLHKLLGLTLFIKHKLIQN